MIFHQACPVLRIDRLSLCPAALVNATPADSVYTAVDPYPVHAARCVAPSRFPFSGAAHFLFLFLKKRKLITHQVQTASSIVPKRYPPFRSPHWEVTHAKNDETNRINIGRSRQHGSDGTRKEVNSGSVSQVGSALQVSLLMESWQLGDDNG